MLTTDRNFLQFVTKCGAVEEDTTALYREYSVCFFARQKEELHLLITLLIYQNVHTNHEI